MADKHLTVAVRRLQNAYGYRADNGNWHWRMSTEEVFLLLERGDALEARALEYLLGEQVKACTAQLGRTRLAFDRRTLTHRATLKAALQHYQERHALVKAWAAEYGSRVKLRQLANALAASREEVNELTAQVASLQKEVAHCHDEAYYQ